MGVGFRAPLGVFFYGPFVSLVWIPLKEVFSCSTRVLSFYHVLHMLYSIELNIAPIKVEPSPIEAKLVAIGLAGSASLHN